jgi:hypothetical protein
MRWLLGCALAVFMAGVCAGCGGSHRTAPPATGGFTRPTHVLHDPACAKNPSSGVHGPDRLRVLRRCAIFEGKVTEAPMKNSDGDVSFDVSPDRGYASMLNAKNRSEGGLHIEIVPRDQPGCTPGHPVTFGDIPGLGTCSGRDVVAPRLGAHVRIVGAWVLDRNNAWYEMHPVWSIKVLR